MSYVQILNCSGDLSSCCSDAGLAVILSLIRTALDVIHIIVPIILIIFAVIGFIQLMINPDEKNGLKKVFNKFVAAVMIFLIPYIVNFTISLVSFGDHNLQVSLHACWTNAKEIKEQIDNTEYQVYETSDAEKKRIPKRETTTVKVGENKEGSGQVVLIAGHSYPPYCSSFGKSDCRGMISSGYDETEETRKLVKLIKAELDSLGVPAVIANALMAGNTDDMNKSFFLECSSGTSLCSKYESTWSNAKYALEIHFNATSSGIASGALLVVNGQGVKQIDTDIMDAVVKHTGKTKRTPYNASIHNISYFRNRGVHITYLETEFYDNKAAMDKYTSVKDEIAKDIAAAIKKHYG